LEVPSPLLEPTTLAAATTPAPIKSAFLLFFAKFIAFENLPGEDDPALPAGAAVDVTALWAPLVPLS